MSKAKRMVPSWTAYALSLAALFIGYIYASFCSTAPYEYLTWGIVGLAGAYFAKRVADKKVLGIKDKSNGAVSVDSINPDDGGLG
jgi:hypothetical protein